MQVAQGGSQLAQHLPAAPATGQMASDPPLDASAQLPVEKIAETAAGGQAGTVAKHPDDLHTSFDAGRAMIDPPRPEPGDRQELAEFMELVSRHESGVAGVVSRFLDDPRDIEEAVQDTFVQAWRHRQQFRHEAAVFTWLYRIATNTALMRLRRRRLVSLPIDELSGADQQQASHDPLDTHPDQLDEVARVRAALAQLPEHHRLVVLLRDVEGFSNAEVAAQLGLTVTTVKAQLHRGRTALRQALHPN